MRTSRGAAFLVAVFLFFGGLLSGCGSGAPPDNIYQGSYRAAYSIPQLNESGTFSYTIEKKGGMTGSFVDTQTNKTRGFRGTMNNSGSFSGEVTEGATRSAVSGVIASTGVPGGDFTLNQNGAEYQGNFTLVGDTSQLPTFTSAYQGGYNGAFNVANPPPGRAASGSVSFSVDQRGSITGSFIESDNDKIVGNNPSGAFLGQVTNDGRFTGAIAYDPANPVAVEGTLINRGDGKADGDFVLVMGGSRFGGSFDEPLALPGNSPFANSYRGTYGIPENGESGTVSFTVEPNGRITGFLSQSNDSPVGTVEGNLSNDGTFSATVTYQPGTFSASAALASRTMDGALATSTLTGGGLAGDFVMTIPAQDADGSIRRDAAGNPVAARVPGNFEITIGGSEVDSIYRGSYSESSLPSVPGLLFPNGAGGAFTPNATMAITIDKEGEMTGTLGGLSVRARVTNDGRFTGTLGAVPMNGKISRQGVLDVDISDATKFQFYPGVSGNLTIRVNGVEHEGEFQGIGGSDEGALPR